MNATQNQKVMRYAELAFKRTKLGQEEKLLSPDETAEAEGIARELGMTHEEILELAAKNLIRDE
jgi:hypothetical protein